MTFKQEEDAGTRFIMSVKKYDFSTRKGLFADAIQDSTFSHTHENTRMFNINSKYFSFFNSKPPTS